MWLLALGGIVYSLGCIFYLIKRVRYMHAVWHFFVLGDAACHATAIAWFVI
jgi:hemolysin III